MPTGKKTSDNSEMAEKISAFFEKKNIAISVKSDRHGCSIYSEPEHRPVARLRIEGDDFVEVLWRYGSRWDEIGDFGGMRMSVNEAIKYVHEDPMNCFWPQRRVKAVADALEALLGLSAPVEKKTMIAPDTKLPVQLTLRERDLIRDKTFCEPDFARLALVKNGFITVPMTLDDIEEVQGYVAAETNHTKDKKLERELDGLFSKLQNFLDRYEEE